MEKGNPTNYTRHMPKSEVTGLNDNILELSSTGCIFVADEPIKLGVLSSQDLAPDPIAKGLAEA